MKIELGRDGDYQMRDGRSVRILAVDASCISDGDHYPVIAIAGTDLPSAHTTDGKIYAHSESASILDIINRPRKYRVEGWLNVYRNMSERQTMLHLTKEHADVRSKADRIDCVHVVLEGIDGGTL